MSGRREVLSGSIGAHKDMEKVLKKCRKAGWRVFVTGGSHVLVMGPQGQRVSIALTPNENGLRQDLKRLQKAGAPV